jgi:hypothetical protein
LPQAIERIEAKIHEKHPSIRRIFIEAEALKGERGGKPVLSKVEGREA